MFGEFTDGARAVMQASYAEALRLNHNRIDTEHVLLGLTKEPPDLVAALFKNLNIDPQKLRAEVEQASPMSPEAPEGGQVQLRPTKRVMRVVEYAAEASNLFKARSVAGEHLLMALLREEGGTAGRILTGLGLTPDQVREEVEALQAMLELRDLAAPRPVSTKSKTPALDSFGRDLTELARQGKLDPVIGRANEIRRVIQILARRQKNNPVLLGEAGVGKTAIVEGLADLIANEAVPGLFLDTRVVVLDLAMMVAGTKYRGQFEERIKAVMNEVRRAKNVMLFIDELHTLVGAGGAEGAIDASNVLKPALARGEIQCIGATTPDEYRKYIEKDPALAQRFQEVVVSPPNIPDTVEILKGLRDRLEAHHRVQITDSAVTSAVELTDIFVLNRALPVKAIDAIDEACARVRLKAMFRPPDLKEIDERIDKLNTEKEAAVMEQDFEKAAHLRDQAEKLKKEKERVTRAWREKLKETDGVVDEDEVVAAVSQTTGFPSEALSARDRSVLPATVRDGVMAVGVPEYERKQAESVLQGAQVRIMPGTGFVLLPHTPEFEEIFVAAIRPALEENGISALKANDIYKPGLILSQVWNHILSSEVVIADVTGINANVIFELGLCYGLHRSPILLVRDPKELPFNLRNLRYIEYKNTPGGGLKLREDLTRAIEAFLSVTRPPNET